MKIDGVDSIVFTLPEWKSYGLIVIDYYRLWDYSLSLEWQIESLEGTTETWKMKSDNWKTAMEDQKQRADGFYLAFNEERKLRLSNELKERVWGWVPWAIVIVESVAIGALGIYAGAAK